MGDALKARPDGLYGSLSPERLSRGLNKSAYIPDDTTLQVTWGENYLKYIVGWDK